MIINEALTKLTFTKREYFKWKFNLYFDTGGNCKPRRTEEEFLNLVHKKTLASFERWERTEQYKTLVAIYLQGMFGNDLLEVYDAVSKKAKNGDSKAVDTLFKLQSQIKQIAKKPVSKKDAEQEDDDGLEL